MPRWSTEIQQGRQAFSELAEWWDEQSATSDNPLLNSGVLGAWSDGLEETSSRLTIAVLRRDGEPAAALPLYKAGLSYRTLLRNYASEMTVVTNADPEVAERLPAWIDGLGMAYLYRFSDDSPIVRSFDEHRRWVRLARISSPYVDLSDGMEAVRATWSKNFRKGLDRRRRRLEETGEVRFVAHPGPAEVAETLARGLELEASGWKGREGVAALTSDGYAGWFRAVAEIAESRGWLRLGALYLNDQMVAFTFDLEYGRRRHSLLSAYSEADDVARLSPGSALVERVLDDAAARGMETYELGYGDQPWKYDWTTSERFVNDILVLGSGALGRGASLARSARRLLQPNQTP